ncbi:MAG: PAS domain S-box protein [Nitrospirae bacterium]|nr:PAS domain S-box protein [Nitrospirota bacterium]
MNRKLRILNLEDSGTDTELIHAVLEEEGIESDIIRVETEGDFLAALDKAGFDLLLVDYKLPSFDGMSALAIAQRICPEIPFIFVSGSIGEDMAIEAMKYGATDYVLKTKLDRLAPAVRRALNESAERSERKRAEDLLRESEEKYRNLVERAHDGIIIVQDGIIAFANAKMAELDGSKPEQLVGSPYTDHVHPSELPRLADIYRRRMAGEMLPGAYETVLLRRDGASVPAELNAGIIVYRGRPADLVIVRDITERRKLERAQEASLRFLKTMHKHTEIGPLLEELAASIKDFTGCDSVAIRALDKEGNIPYQAHKGFSSKFLELEGPLSIMSDQCMCINVIKGTTNPLLPFYTKGGSFYMNGTTRFLATVSEEEKGKTRNACNKAGYESVALVPFRSGDHVLGLIHVADHRENMVPLELVEQLENAAMQLGTAFQRANAEYALRESEERYRRLFQNMLEGYAYCKMLYDGDRPYDFVYLHVNKAFEGLTGLKNVLGKKASEVIPGIQESDPELFTIYGRVALTGNPERFEMYVASMGSWFSIAAYSSEREHFVTVFDNITERKRTEEALRTSEHQYRQLVDNALVGIYRATTEGKFLYVNDALARIFECDDTDEMLKLPVGMRYKKPEDRAAFLSILKERGSVPYYEMEVPTKSGKLKTIVISAVIEDEFITGMVTDITERKHLEAQLRHAQKMEAVGTLAGGIAHDFNNLLNVIMGFGAMVMEKLAPDSPLKEHMNEVLMAAGKAANLTGRLLVFSRKQVVAVKSVNINELIDDIRKMLVRLIGEDVDFQVKLAEAPLMVMADAGQIEQVLMNLASNARDAMPAGGSLTIGTGTEEVDDEYVAVYGYGSPGTYAVITVSDTGHGIDRDTQKKIFEPFFTTKGIGEGTGLGLAISYGIIKKHNGYIKVYSEPGQGALFKIYLPLVEGRVSPEKKKEEAGGPLGGNETVLVAEDDASMRKLTRVILEAAGYTVITAEDGEDAITKFAENRDKIRLAVVDMIMPKKNGKEVSEAIRGTSPQAKILFVSGYTMDNIKTRELVESGFDFIHKPILPKDFLNKVREVLDRR